MVGLCRDDCGPPDDRGPPEDGGPLEDVGSGGRLIAAVRIAT